MAYVYYTQVIVQNLPLSALALHFYPLTDRALDIEKSTVSMAPALGICGCTETAESFTLANSAS